MDRLAGRVGGAATGHRLERREQERAHAHRAAHDRERGEAAEARQRGERAEHAPRAPQHGLSGDRPREHRGEHQHALRDLDGRARTRELHEHRRCDRRGDRGRHGEQTRERRGTPPPAHAHQHRARHERRSDQAEAVPALERRVVALDGRHLPRHRAPVELRDEAQQERQRQRGRETGVDHRLAPPQRVERARQRHHGGDDGGDHDHTEDVLDRFVHACVLGAGAPSFDDVTEELSFRIRRWAAVTEEPGPSRRRPRAR